MNKERYELKVYDRLSKESYYVNDNETGQHMNIRTLVEILNNGTNRIAELKAENERLKEFVDKLDAEFGKNVEPTLSEKADNIIALHRTNKAYCERAQQQLKEKDEEIEKLKSVRGFTEWTEKYENIIISLKRELKTNTKQVCEKIRELWKKQAIYYHICDSGEVLNNKTYQCTILGMNEVLFENMIKEIEKGEV